MYGHIYGHIWPCMAIYGHICGHIWPYIAVWPYTAIYGYIWPYIYGHIWLYMAIYEWRSFQAECIHDVKCRTMHKHALCHVLCFNHRPLYNVHGCHVTYCTVHWRVLKSLNLLGPIYVGMPYCTLACFWLYSLRFALIVVQDRCGRQECTLSLWEANGWS